jgi:maltokinase
VTEAALQGPEGLAELLAEWLPRQRWFAGKGREFGGTEVLSCTTLFDDAARLDHVLLAVAHGSQTDRYQLLVGLRRELPQRLEYVAIGRLGDLIAYDATHDPELAGVLLDRLVHGSAAETALGPLSFVPANGEDLQTGLSSRVLGVEQSNTSIVYADTYILKLFRRLSPGLNPELEVGLALAQAGSTHIARPLAWIEGRLDGRPTTFAVLQQFLSSATDGWAMATTSVRDLLAEGDLHANEVGGDFAGEAERLGTATAEVHRDLALVLPTRSASPAELAVLGERMRARLETAAEVVPELERHADALVASYDAVGTITEPVTFQRIHGDLHLGQVLRTDSGWVLLDFEGEPARPMDERVSLDSPLRDVAGMLRSFDYAARQLLAEAGTDPQREYRANEWAERNRTAFCDGYAKGSGTDPRGESTLLRAYELDKAVYEVVYEARHRPSWISIPLGSIEKLAG